ncbi:MAG TPA: TIGR03960 family B12-binding radical SAM protein [Syntrophales bacterium]|nr:TIGR03960 family B12-binding radical SAM protein [Syntrophales bacterium]
MSWKLEKKYSDILDNEKGYQKKTWGDLLTVCLAYPNYYRTGMSNLGLHSIYSLINHQSSFLCERVFLPEPKDEALFTAGSMPLFSLESQKPLTEFDIIAFSIPFENDYPNILKMLTMAGITISAGERRKTEPLIISGGVSVTLNPEPLADFFDLFLLGEGEEVLPEFLSVFEDSRRLGLNRSDLLFRIQKETQGAYVPKYYKVNYQANHLIENIKPVDAAFPERIKTRRISDINAFTTDQCISAPVAEFKDLFLTETSRGCQRGCRFCAAGFLYRPARFRNLTTLQSSFDRGIKERTKIGLIGTAVSDHPDMNSICRYIINHKGGVAVGSFRLDRLESELVSLLKESGIETLSLAPEAGSQRLRNVIHKGITDEHIMNAVRLLIEHGIANIRLYFMIGLPTETEEDIEAIIDLIKKIKHHATKISAGKRRFKRITLSINQFIPKPVTPFQWHPLEEINTVRKKLRKIDGAMRKESSVKVIHDLPKWNYIQALLSLGDRKVGSILLSAHKNNGNWPKAFKEVNVNPDFYVYRYKSTDETLPWDFIDHGINKQYLIAEYRKAMEGGAH